MIGQGRQWLANALKLAWAIAMSQGMGLGRLAKPERVRPKLGNSKVAKHVQAGFEHAVQMSFVRGVSNLFIFLQGVSANSC